MTMMMNARRAAAALALLALPAPAFAAGDGQLAEISNASFEVKLNIATPIGSRVQIIGLDDFDFRNVTALNNTATNAVIERGYFCLNRSDSGPVSVSISQGGLGTGDSFRLAGAGGPAIGLTIQIDTPDSSASFILANGIPAIMVQSGFGCNDSTVFSPAHTMTVYPTSVPSNNTIVRSGQFTGTFTVRVAVPS